MSENPTSSIPSYLNQFSPEYLDELKEAYDKDPASLPLSWRLFFDGMALGQTAIIEEDAKAAAADKAKRREKNKARTQKAVDLERRIVSLIEGYRQRGHLLSTIDPLGRPRVTDPARLELKRFELDQVKPDDRFQAASIMGLPPSPLSEIVSHLQQTYCRNIGVEYMHISDEKAKNWLEARMEPNKNYTTFTPGQKKQFLYDISEATLFEDFLQRSFTGQKRFSLEGAEVVIPAMKQIVRLLAGYGVKETVIGMAHRGRLNVLANVMRKPLESVFSEFFGAGFSSDFKGSGDVKYHMGYSQEVDVNGDKIHMSLAFNPSHLEAVGPVVQGMTRAKQNNKYGGDHNSIVPILVHGDAAVIGQGVVAETLNMAGLEGYAVGGSLHIVINNQIGFTTLPEDARSTLYCTDFAKAAQSPIIHVNGDDVFAVVHAVTLAAEFRMKFNRDVFVDINCYRRYGHNEGDEPRFTQPSMYSKISSKKNSLKHYQEVLLKQGDVDQSHITQVEKDIKEGMSRALEAVKEKPKDFDIEAFGKHWMGLRSATEEDLLCEFHAPIEEAKADEIIELIHKVPETVKPLPKFIRMLDQRLKKIKEEDKIDWAVAEQIAFGSILQDGQCVRLSGQDSKRGTFSHRHIEMTDGSGPERVMPLQALETEEAKLYVYNSPLSEFSVMGFDFGYASSAPKTLTIWEAQFGDFANSAQVMIDQFLTATESKWRRMNGLVLLLPHGYEGQGPEHSSARLERYLQLAAEGNMQVCYPTTPAQFCHLLRRQVLRDFRKPLVVMSPKSPLRMAEVISTKDQVCNGRFEHFLLSGAEPEQAKRVVLCSGKVYWDLARKAAETGKDQETAFVRVEQIYPLDLNKLKELRKKYSNAKDWVWCQEEPKNMGTWEFFRMHTLDIDLPLRYAGRARSASPATGSPKTHAQEQENLVNQALAIEVE